MTTPATPLTTVAELFVAVEDRALANQLVNPILGQPDDIENFVRELSPSAEPPATAYGAFARLSDARWLAIRDALAMGVPSIRYYARGLRKAGSPVSDRLLETNSPTAVTQIGQLWSSAASLQDAGVTPVVVAPF
jgi:hypothetical protein